MAASGKRAWKRWTRGDYVGVSVVDNGRGMAPDVLARALDPFFTTKGQRTGLGLPQACAFAAQSHGLPVLDSAPGTGTRADIFLPRAHRAGLRAGAHASPCASAALPRARGKVLFVETIRWYAKRSRALEESGFEVLAASNGEQALACSTAAPGRR